MAVAEANMCFIDDVEVCEKGVHEVSTVDDDGDGLEHKETYMGEITDGYYYCDGCTQFWPWNMKNRLEVWKEVKAHLHV